MKLPRAVLVLLVIGIISIFIVWARSPSSTGGGAVWDSTGNSYECLVTLQNPFYIGHTVIETVNCIPRGKCNPLFYFSAAQPLSLFAEQGILEYKNADVSGQESFDVAEGGRESIEFSLCTKDTKLLTLLIDEDGSITDQRTQNLPVVASVNV